MGKNQTKPNKEIARLKPQQNNNKKCDNEIKQKTQTKQM